MTVFYLLGVASGSTLVAIYVFLFGPLTVGQERKLWRRSYGLVLYHLRQHDDCDVCRRLIEGVEPWNAIEKAPTK